MNPIDFEGQRSKVKVTMDIYGNKLLNMIETKPLCISLTNLADILTTVNPIDLEVTVHRVTMGIIDKCGVRGDATLCVVIFITNIDLQSYFSVTVHYCYTSSIHVLVRVYM